MMSAIIIEHVRVGDLPEAWRTQSSTALDTRVTIRIEEEAPQNADDMANDPLFGMWSDREDMTDVESYVRDLRAPRFNLDGSRKKG